MSNDLRDLVEDHAPQTDRPDNRQGWLALTATTGTDRQGWMALSWNTATTSATLVQLFIGALVTCVAGIRIALAAGLLVTVVGALIGWACGHVAWRSGLSSTMLFRHFAFGRKGSLVAILIFGYMIVGFLGITNTLIYYGFLFTFQLQDTVWNAAIIYGAMTAAWIGLGIFASRLTPALATTTLILFVAVLVAVTLIALTHDADPFSHHGLLFAEGLEALHIADDSDKFIFCANLLMASSGALALSFADSGRRARRSRDIAVAAVVSNVIINILMVFAGGVLLSMPLVLIGFHISSGLPLPAGFSAGPHAIVPIVIGLGGLIIAVLLLLTQVRAQMLNTACTALLVANLFAIFPVLRWRPGWPVLVIIANALALFALYARVLEQTVLWATILGVQTAVFAAILIIDYYIVRVLAPRSSPDTARPPESVNWAGVVAAIIGAIISHHALPTIFPLQFLTAMCVCLILYPALRLTVAKPKSPTTAA